MLMNVLSAPPASGFSDSVHDSQKIFRAALQAMSHPGRVQKISAECGVPPGLSKGMTAVLLTLVDADTPVWLPQGVNEQVRHYLRFHCACPFVSDPCLARFVVVPTGFDAPSIDACCPGDPAFPDTSTTMLLEVQSLDDSPSHEPVVFTGPGIKTEQAVSVAGLPDRFWEQWKANHQQFPLGVDAFLIQENNLCGLPRTVSVEG